ncbi:hypothetical protein MMC09_002666 [Bachmanniomyces sp. S44760]|nr:hypothetical protein [Bachmanniomyces sp. S44760]
MGLTNYTSDDPINRTSSYKPGSAPPSSPPSSPPTQIDNATLEIGNVTIPGVDVDITPRDNEPETLQDCGGAFYYPSKYICYGPGNENFLCPVDNGKPLKQCGPACYTEQYICVNGILELAPVPKDK